jgi:hypothetical protein
VGHLFDGEVGHDAEQQAVALIRRELFEEALDALGPQPGECLILGAPRPGAVIERTAGRAWAAGPPCGGRR